MNLQKVTKAQAKQIADEIERNHEYMKYFDRQKHKIKQELTHFNYDLVHSGLSTAARLEKRLSEIKVMNRADVKPLGQWAITMPKDLDPALQDLFFSAVYDFFKQEYGEENIIYAVVHLDETTPHMHLGAVPVALNDKGQEHLSAKKVFTRNHLQHIHANCQKFCESRLGCEVNLLNGETLGVKGVEEFKRMKEFVKEVGVLETRRDTLSQEIAELTETKNDLQKEITEKKGILAGIKDFLIGHPNFFDMFLHWLRPEYEREERQRICKEFEEDLKQTSHMSRGMGR